MRVSVVVPSRDRPDQLAACLVALRAQRRSIDEIVVVDDGSVDAAAVAVVAAGTLLVRGEGRGPAAARNLGARTATGDVVLFTDDDCRPSPEWAAALVQTIEAGARVAAGPTEVGTGGGRPAIAAQIVTNHLVRQSLDPLCGTVGFAPTCNLGARAEVLADLPFDESYPLAAGEDRDWCDRLAAMGPAIGWVPDAFVAHHPTLGLRGFWRQQLRYGRGAHRFRTTSSRQRPPLRFYLALLASGFRRGPTVGILVLVAQLATAIGYAREARAAKP